MRLFTAVNFNEQVKDRLCDMQSQLKEHAFSGNFTEYENLHMTLIFLGEVPGSQVGLLQNIMEEVKAESFEIKINGMGSFKRGRGALWWAQVLPEKKLLALYQQLHEKISDEGFRLEKDKFKPHITLAREVVLFHGCDTVKFAKDDTIVTEVSSVSLMKSERINGRLSYTEIFSREFF